MTTYARIKDGIVHEIVTLPVEMSNVPVEKLYAHAIADTWVVIDAVTPKPAYGWLYDGSNFSEPPAGEARIEWARKLGYNVDI